MTFWQTMWSRLTGGAMRQREGTQDPGPSGGGNAPAVVVTDQTALQVSAVWACVRLISQTVASLPLLVYRKTPAGRVVVTDHWFAQLMARRPNRYQTRYEFWEHMAGNLALHGNMYAKKTVVGGKVRSLLPLNPLQVETRLLAGSITHLFSTDGEVAALSAESVWHARMNGDLIVGRSPLQFGASVIGVAQAAEKAVTGIYTNGGKRSGVLTLDRLLTKEQRAVLREKFASLTTGTDDRLLLLENGAKFEPVAMSPQDIELLASRKYQIDEIARWFGVPSILINQNEGSTTLGSSTREIMEAFYKLNLRPYLEALENSIIVNLFDEKEAQTYEVEFDFEGLLRADMTSRFEGYRTAITSAVMTPNEARALEWLPKIEGGDKLFMQGAMVPIDTLGNAPAPPEGNADGT